MTGVPGAVRRLSRDRSRLIAVVLLAVVALSASGIQSAAAVALQRTLDANWRGAYDILVTAKGAKVGVGGLLAPNSLGDGAHGMTLKQVAKVRQIAGIDVAAPIGEVISPLKMEQPVVNLSLASVGATAVPQAFRITMKYTTNDGISTRVVSSKSGYVIIDNLPEVAPPVSTTGCNLDGFDVDQTKYPLMCQSFIHSEYSQVTVSDEAMSGYGQGGFDSSENVAQRGTIQFDPSVNNEPSGLTRVTLVDPAAEKKLLGGAGSFLIALERLHPSETTPRSVLDTWAKESTSTFASDYLAQQAAAGSLARVSPKAAAVNAEIKAFNKEHNVQQDATVDHSAYVPLLVSRASSAKLTYTMDVKSLGAAPRVMSTPGESLNFPYAVPTTSTGSEVGSTSVDASALLNPFVRTPVELSWPGSTQASPGDPNAFASLFIGAAGEISPSETAVTISRSGVVSATRKATGYAPPVPPQDGSQTNPFQLFFDGTTPGNEAAYTTVTNIPHDPHNANSVVVPVGSFSTDQLAGLQSSLSYVPLGAYQPVGSFTDKGVKLQPSVSGVGLVSPQTVAIASIYSAPAWGQTAPVSAIRVRVADISSYSPQSQQKVIAVAQAIQKLGLTATIVAGSSPTSIKVAVDGYAFGVTDATKKQRVGPLGTVTQQWSELGAAARADVAVSTASLSVLGIALGSTALLLGAVQFASVPRRRGQAAVMREIGWTRGRIRRWMFAEEVPGAIVVLLAGLAAVLLSGLQQVSITIAAAGVSIVVLTSVAAVVLGARGRARVIRSGQSGGRRMLRLRGRSTVTFGLRQARIHLLTSITQVVAVLIVALASAGLAEVFLEGRRQAGSSLLAQFTTGQAALFQLVLGAVALASGIILAVLARRVDLARRSPQWAALRATGWTARDLKRAQRTESATVAIPAILLAAAATYGGVLLLGLPAIVPLMVVGAAAAVVASLALLFVRRKATAQ